ncbi:MAG: LTA synthase family protein [Ruminococcus sp.]|nr:LTA synthase family protein [Ruminococcus sp.]
MSRYQEKVNKLNERLISYLEKTGLVKKSLPFVTYFLYFLVSDVCYSMLCYYLRTELLDLMHLTHFSPFTCLFTAAVLCLLPMTAQRIAFGIYSLLCTLYGFAQLVVISSNGSMVRFVNVFTGKDAIQFAGSVFKRLPVSVYITYALLIVLAVLIEIFMYRKAAMPEKGRERLTARIVCTAMAVVSAVPVVLNAPPDKLSNRYYIYKNFIDTNTVFDESDLYTYAFHDIQNMAMKNFYAEKNKKKLDAYFENKLEHTDNEMTGIFKGKNLLIIQLESFDKDLITSGHCKNLKEIYDKSIVFDNYYGMRFGSEPTIDNEMAVNTGLYATTDIAASSGLSGISFANSLSNTFKNNGYSTDVYHKNDAVFYRRDITEVSVCYDRYTPLPALTDEKILGEDDFVIADNDDIYNTITSSDPFMHYIVTYSAHPQYNVYTHFDIDVENRYIALQERHSDYSFDQTMPMEVYKAFALLTDDMAERLIERMEEDGSLDDTVLLFVSDHACLETLEKTTSQKRYLEAMNIPFFIYAKGIEPQVIEKTCSNVDILPTVVNMFGLESNNKYLGNDIFSDSEGLAFLPTFNWVTDRCSYIDGSIDERFDDEDIDSEYIDRINETVRERIELNNIIIYTNYFDDD